MDIDGYMNRRRRIVPATQLRVHLGEALRGLDEEDIVIEKGGVPIALLTRYERSSTTPREGDAMMNTNASTAYNAALLKKGNPNGIARAIAAMNKGIPGWDADRLVADLYTARAAGTKPFSYSVDDDNDESEGGEGDDGEVSPGQRYLHSGDEAGTQRVAEERAHYEADRGRGD
jgi:hypothetical protein